MKNKPYQILKWIIENRKEFYIHAIIYFIFGFLIKLIYEFLLKGTPFEKNVIIILTIIMISLAIITSTLLVFFKRRLKTDDLLSDIYGTTWRNSQYYQRKNHYTEEKNFLSMKLVNEQLSNTLHKFYEDYQKNNGNSDNINLIIDSGTTLVPIFEYLPKLKMQKTYRDKLKVFTNNIAGIEELHRSFKDDSEYNESNYYLIGGNPLHKYMATTIAGFDATKKNLTSLLDPYQGVKIGIVTSNWIIGGAQLTGLTLCAKGRGHYEFKKALVELCEYIIVVAPLGKILKLENVEELNKIVGDDYETIPLTKVAGNENISTTKDRNKVFLFTTFRDRSTSSPLNDHSINLANASHMPALKFTFLDPIPKFCPNGSAKEVHFKEIPHEYMHNENFQTTYGYHEPSYK